MRKNIYLYLFLFVLLLILFQYMNQKKIFERQENKIEELRERANKAEDSLEVLSLENHNLNYFTLQGNENAMGYLERLGYEAADVETLISEKIYDFNLQKGNNPLVPFEGMNGDMKINKVKFLNHKWIQADFTDGKFWGEMILEYYFKENGDLDLTPIASFLYQN
ncbi:hydrolase [Aequorivita sinensis]|uniref:hydrolase n=1 Tax=Aequorivita sinensis TaxID=1382458 RepID=UPI0023006C4D|nr:hydrolase [Aequorivita sinensis]